jgi:hypothetical protein
MADGIGDNGQKRVSPASDPSPYMGIIPKNH